MWRLHCFQSNWHPIHTPQKQRNLLLKWLKPVTGFLNAFLKHWKLFWQWIAYCWMSGNDDNLTRWLWHQRHLLPITTLLRYSQYSEEFPCPPPSEKYYSTLTWIISRDINSSLMSEPKRKGTTGTACKGLCYCYTRSPMTFIITKGLVSKSLHSKSLQSKSLSN